MEQYNDNSEFDSRFHYNFAIMGKVKWCRVNQGNSVAFATQAAIETAL